MFGAETDLQLSDADDVFAPWKFSNPWFGTLRGRAGVALNNVMFYGTVGLAYGSLTAQSTADRRLGSKNQLRLGRRSRPRSRLDGQLVGQERNTSTSTSTSRSYSLTGASHGINSSLLRLGVNYRF